MAYFLRQVVKMTSQIVKDEIAFWTRRRSFDMGYKKVKNLDAGFHLKRPFCSQCFYGDCFGCPLFACARSPIYQSENKDKKVTEIAQQMIDFIKEHAR